MAEAEGRAAAQGWRRMAVIAALGTRRYYERLGYRLGETYMLKDLPSGSKDEAGHRRHPDLAEPGS
jgi:predicted N-acetyltransferase YhbS